MLSQLSYGPFLGPGGLEPPTPRLSSVCSNQLSYRPFSKKVIYVRADLIELLLNFGKEVIQPQVPLRLPCYDFVPVMNHTVASVSPCGLNYPLLVSPTPMT